MSFTSTPQGRAARIAGTAAAIDSGTSNGYLEIYGGSRPSAPTDAPSTSPLVVIVFAKPCGSITGAVLTLAQADSGGDLIANTGPATWARLHGGDGTALGDGSVSDDSGTGDFKVAGTSGTNLYAGGSALLGTTTLG